MPYLDHAAAALPSKDQLEAAFAPLVANISYLANPHSHHPAGLRTQSIVDAARLGVLKHFHTNSSEYSVVFTSNATSALRIVAESFQFASENPGCSEIGDTLQNNLSQFVYMQDAHHSVVGLREVVRYKAEAVVCLSSDRLRTTKVPEVTNSLFMMTAMSNFSGEKYPLEHVMSFQEKGWSVCLDAASLVSSSSLDLHHYNPDFVAISFYKMFGYPTGLGALLIRKKSENLLKTTRFAGGTVTSVVNDKFLHTSREGHEMFEEGTINYTAIAALRAGFADLAKYGGMERIREQTYVITKYAFELLTTRKHSNGNRLAVVYTANENLDDSTEQGPILAFNLMQPDGKFYGYKEVEKIASIFGIELRTGCFCNIGACREYLKMAPSVLESNILRGKKCGDEMDLINGRPTGAVRISFGRQSTIEDVQDLDKMLQACFLDKREMISVTTLSSLERFNPAVKKIVCYPVKSCIGVSLDSDELTKSGLKDDRMFMMVHNDVTVTLKTHPQICRLFVDVFDRDLLLGTVEGEKIRVPMEEEVAVQHEESVVCSSSVRTDDCGDVVASWVESALDLPGCRLRRVAPGSDRSFVNDSPYLLINEASAMIIARETSLELADVIRRFRPNIVISGLPPFFEQGAKTLQIDNIRFDVKGPCTRCEMIAICPFTGIRDPSIIMALRNSNVGGFNFGIYISQAEYRPGEFIHVGSQVSFAKRNARDA